MRKRVTFIRFSDVDTYQNLATNCEDGRYVVWRDPSVSTNNHKLNLSVLKGQQVHHIPIAVYLYYLLYSVHKKEYY